MFVPPFKSWRRHAVGAEANRLRPLPKLRPRRNKYGEQRPPHHHYQEESGSWWTPRRRLEGCLCRFRHRHDGALHRALAAQYQQAREGSRRRVLPRSFRHSQQNGQQERGHRREFHYITKDNVSDLMQKLQKTIQQMPDFDKLQHQIEMTITSEGLRIEMMETETGTFFDVGSPRPNGNGKELLVLLAQELGKVPNRISIEGHTDSRAFTKRGDYGNWELSVDRANAARRLMQENGVRPDQISQVRGFADQMLRKPND